MALTDIVLAGGEYCSSALMSYTSTATIKDIVMDQLHRGIQGSSFKHVSAWPAIGDVKSGVKYGPTSVEYTGTYSAGGSGFSVVGNTGLVRSVI